MVATTRRVSLTSAGAQLLERFAPAMAEREAAFAETRDGRERPTGTVRLHVPRPAFARHVDPALGRLRASLPDVTIDLTIGDGPTDVAVGSYDLVVRRAAFVDDGMAALDLGGDLRHMVIAAPDYLAATVTPTTPDDLMFLRCIRWRLDGGETQGWQFEVDGAPLTLSVEGPLIVSNSDAAVSAALQGVGIAYVLESYCAHLVADGSLTSLLHTYLPAFGGWKLCHAKRTKLTAARKRRRSTADVHLTCSLSGHSAINAGLRAVTDEDRQHPPSARDVGRSFAALYGTAIECSMPDSRPEWITG